MTLQLPHDPPIPADFTRDSQNIQAREEFTNQDAPGSITLPGGGVVRNLRGIIADMIAGAFTLSGTYDELADAMLAPPDGAAVGSYFNVRPNGPDELDRLTLYKKTGTSTQELVADFASAAEFDALGDYLSGLESRVVQACVVVTNVGGNAYEMSTTAGTPNYAGKLIRCKLPTNTSGTVTFAVDGGGQRPVLDISATPIGVAPRMLEAGRLYTFEFSATGSVWYQVDDSTLVYRMMIVEGAAAAAQSTASGAATAASAAQSTATSAASAAAAAQSTANTAVSQAGTANANIITAGTFPIAIDPSSTPNAIVATCAQAPGTLPQGFRIEFILATTNTAAITLSLNGSAPRPLHRSSGGPMVAGEIQAQTTYVFGWQAGGATWRLLSDSGANESRRYAYQYGVTVGGTANAITVASAEPSALPAPGMLLGFLAAGTNTGAVTLALNGGAVLPIVKQGSAPLVAEDIGVNSPILLQYQGSPANHWLVVASGALGSDVSSLDSRVDALESVSQPLAPLRSKLITNPYGDITFADGVKTITKNRIVTTLLANSLGQGAGASAGHAPSQFFCAALQTQLNQYGQFEVVDDNQSVPGTVVSEFAAQWAASPESLKNVVLIYAGTNDFPVAAYNSGQTFPNFVTALDERIRVAKDSGAIVIVMTCAHMHPDRYSIVIPDGLPLVWPVVTYNVPYPHTFATSDQSIAGPFSIFGGQVLTVGATLRVMSGPNAGDHEITGFNGDRSKVFVDGTIVSSGTENVQVRHVDQDLETVLTPAASVSKVTRDWTGNGIPVVGDVRFWHGNNAIRDAARRHGVMLVDCEQAFFRAVEIHGYDALYDIGNFNHPNDLGYELGIDEPLDRAVLDVCRQLLQNITA